jgi:Tfp pilus assembly protein PilF
MRDDESQKVLRQSIWLDAMAFEPYVVLGKVFLRERQHELAEKNLNRAISLDSGNYTAHFILAQLYREQGKAEAAEREMKVAARIQQLLGSNAGRN